MATKRVIIAVLMSIITGSIFAQAPIKRIITEKYPQKQASAIRKQRNATVKRNPQVQNKTESEKLLQTGFNYIDGIGVAQNSKIAYNYFLQSANLGNSEAMVMLGGLYEDGDGVIKNYNQAREWYEKAINLGDTEAMVYLAFMYRDGLGVPVNILKCISLLQQASNQNDGYAQTALGTMYLEGLGVEKSYKKAYELFMAAIGNKCNFAYHKLGEMYIDGKYVAQDFSKAFECLNNSAIAGDSESIYLIGALYENGLGIHQDLQMAYGHYLVAKERGVDCDEDIERIRGLINQNKQESKQIFNDNKNNTRTVSKQTIDVNGISMNLVFIPNGNVIIGNNKGSWSNISEREIHIDDFYVCETEVTQELWVTVMKKNPSRFVGNKKPVDSVSLKDCKIFIQKLNEITGKEFRLPTEAEWEYAANGCLPQHTFEYCGSNNINEVAWFKGNSNGETHNVMTKSPNQIGLYDMSGNVYEMCMSVEVDSDVIYKGGCWDHTVIPCSTTYRCIKPDKKHIGFRLVMQ